MAVPALGATTLAGIFEMTIDGTRLACSRPVHNADSLTLSGVMELGHGSLTGNCIQLEGGAASNGYSDTSTYQGHLDGDHAVLTGEQVWIAPSLRQPYHRDCRITLKR